MYFSIIDGRVGDDDPSDFGLARHVVVQQVDRPHAGAPTHNTGDAAEMNVKGGGSSWQVAPTESRKSESGTEQEECEDIRDNAPDLASPHVDDH
jgi:hypothetical protein